MLSFHPDQNLKLMDVIRVSSIEIYLTKNNLFRDTWVVIFGFGVDVLKSLLNIDMQKKTTAYQKRQVLSLNFNQC